MPHSPSAYLLVSHGSRDPRPQVEMAHLTRLVARQLSQRDWVAEGDDRLPFSILEASIVEASIIEASIVEAAVLELALPLHEQIQRFAERAVILGCQRLQVMPIFLLPGVHVMEDIPAEVAIAQQILEDTIALEICPYLGSHANLREIWLDLAAAPSPPHQGRILLGHGSRRAGGNQSMEAIASQVNVFPAYWSVAPSLTDQINFLVGQGCTQIEILPYFLFEGGITDAIAQSVQDLGRQFPDVHLRWIPPRGATAQLARLIVAAIADSNEVLNTVREAAKT